MIADTSSHDAFDELASALLKESDRGCVMIAAAFLDDALEEVLRSFFRTDPFSLKNAVDPLLAGNGPISTFSSRIQLCYALMLITTNMRKELDLTRKLRNDFAHTWGPMDFDDPLCVERMKALGHDYATRESAEWDMPLRIGARVIARGELTRRLAFILRTCNLIGRLYAIRDTIRQGRDVRRITLFEEADVARTVAEPQSDGSKSEKTE